MKNVNIAIYCNTKKTKLDGTSTLSIRITIDRHAKYISLSKYIKPHFFDSKKKRVKEVKGIPNAKALNRLLSEYEIKVDSIVDELERQNEPVTFDRIKDIFHGEQDRGFYSFCLKCLETEKLTLKESSIEGLKYKMKKIQQFSPNISLQDITKDWILKFTNFCLYDLGNSYNSTVSDNKLIGKYLGKALKQGLIKKSPYDEDTKLNWVEVKKDYLNIDELLKALEYYKSKKLLSLKRKDKRGKVYPYGKRHQNILQYFLIGCFTGLRISDIQTLRKENIDFIENEIVKKMQKGKKHKEKTVKIPLTSHIMDTLNISDSNHLYPGNVIISSKTNYTLREILTEQIGICKNKHITFHCSRRTFGVTALTLGMPLETVQNLMGHSEIKTTQIYAKIVDSKRHKDMRVWNDLNKIAS